jgi:hypothetical protein
MGNHHEPAVRIPGGVVAIVTVVRVHVAEVRAVDVGDGDPPALALLDRDGESRPVG